MIYHEVCYELLGSLFGGLQLLLSSLKHSSSLWGPNHPLMIACLESFLFTLFIRSTILKQKIEIYLLLVTFVNFWLGLSLNPAYYFWCFGWFGQITKCTLCNWLYFHHHYFNIIVCAQHFWSHHWWQHIYVWHIYWHTFPLMHMQQFAHVAYIYHFKDMIVAGTYMTIAG